MEKVIIYSNGITCCGVCAENSLNIKEISKRVNELNPIMSSYKRKFSEDRFFNGGKTNLCSCEKFAESRKHYLFNY